MAKLLASLGGTGPVRSLNRLPRDHFVRFPTHLLNALLTIPLTGTQFRIVLWVIRYTVGYHRASTAFSWYSLAHKLRLDRAAAYRAGVALIQANILVPQNGSLAIQADVDAWLMSVVAKQRKALSDNNGFPSS